jgi:hypothetical protein
MKKKETVATSYRHRPCSSPTVWRRQLFFIARDEIDDLHRRVAHVVDPFIVEDVERRAAAPSAPCTEHGATRTPAMMMEETERPSA